VHQLSTQLGYTLYYCGLADRVRLTDVKTANQQHGIYRISHQSVVTMHCVNSDELDGKVKNERMGTDCKTV